MSDVAGAARRGTAWVAGGAIVVVGMLLLWKAATVVLAVFGGTIVALALQGAAVWLSERTGVPAGVGVVLVVLLVVGGACALAWGLADDVAQQFGQLVQRLPIAIIPYIGPLVSFVPAALIASLQGPASVLWVLALYVVVQVLESYLVTPLVQQRAVNVPPALTITAQVALGLIFGAVGLLFATPLTAAVMVAVQLLYVEDVLHEDARVRGARPPSAAT
jgi:predicted PurR-regulated permease PerM